MTRKPKAFQIINSLRERYHIAAVGKKSLLTMLSEVEVAEQVYNSNAIENSTLSLEETEKILLQIDLDRYISEREIFEAKNLARVVEYIDIKAKEQELTLDTMLLLHKMLITNIQDDIAGRFRSPGEFVRVGNHIAPASEEIHKRLENMVAEYNARATDPILTRIARLHLTFEYIHPFNDGNGRIGRAINNYLLIREGYVPINIKFIDRTRYYSAFKEFQSDGKISIMEEIVATALTSSYHKRLAYIEGNEILVLSEYAKKNGLSYTNLLNKAKRQTIEAFLEKGVWKIAVPK